MVKALLEAGATVNFEDAQGQTALDYARDAKDSALATLLLTHGGKPGSGKPKT